ncbi:GatB/YqeY domain-containing protein [Mangrovicoccus algicola]|uniref:GatB/YqeY domain-containing protein n=1 Tax=Mangrovicoccus algicola TaxID=2771008 RepID=A0A8J7CX86_9RHOB|nr:GatB/YqeY domain-containing protein [Mangrovicoccus algicola]MBE3640274.1 GatB/YqeY domain-containing protein [Mangrovicoccus algicola]
MGKDLKARIGESLKQAMKDKDAVRLSTLRLINAAIKDTEIALRAETSGDAEPQPIPDEKVLAILGKMVKQRQESARVYEEGGRLELAEQERGEIEIIEEFLPAKLSAEEQAAAVEKAIAATGAESLRDMGKVMAALKAKYTGQMDFGEVGPLVRARLG